MARRHYMSGQSSSLLSIVARIFLLWNYVIQKMVKNIYKLLNLCQYDAGETHWVKPSAAMLLT